MSKNDNPQTRHACDITAAINGVLHYAKPFAMMDPLLYQAMTHLEREKATIPQLSANYRIVLEEVRRLRLLLRECYDMADCCDTHSSMDTGYAELIKRIHAEMAKLP